MKKMQIRKHIMTGISYMIPMIVAGGILGALAKGFGGYNIGSTQIEGGATIFSNVNILNSAHFWWSVSKLSDYAMSFGVAVMTAGIAYSISDRPGIVPGFIIGYTANVAKTGFLGGLLMGFIIGYFILWMKTWKLPKALAGLMPVLIIPLTVTFVCGLMFLGVFMAPLAAIMTALQNWIIGLNSGSKFVIGAVIGACMGFDMGGPINKTASMAANALAAGGIFGPESAKIVGGMTPPLGIGIATFLVPKKFTSAERDAGLSCIPMGLSFITEGVLPFAAADPLKVIPASMIGSALAGGIAMQLGVESVALHGGIFVVPMMVNPWGFIVALVIGTAVTAVIYALIKSAPTADDLAASEEIIDLDINF